MRANYFRYLYENTDKGTIYTISTAGDTGEFCGYYICGYGKPVFGTKMDERFSICRQEISFMVIEGLCESDRAKMADFMKKNQVSHLVVPYGENAARFQADVKQLTVLEKGQSLSYVEDGRKIWMKCFANGEKGTIAVYCDAKLEETEDCKLNVWPVEKETQISICADKEDQSCEMRNCLYNDFDVCKGHNKKGDRPYVTGTLLLGNVNLKEDGERLLEDLKELQEEIRFVTLPGGGKEELFHPCILEAMKVRKEVNHYFVLPGGMEGNDGTIGKLLRAGIRNRAVLTSEVSGLCAAGLFVEKMEE